MGAYRRVYDSRHLQADFLLYSSVGLISPDRPWSFVRNFAAPRSTRLLLSFDSVSVMRSSSGSRRHIIGPLAAFQASLQARSFSYQRSKDWAAQRWCRPGRHPSAIIEYYADLCQQLLSACENSFSYRIVSNYSHHLLQPSTRHRLRIRSSWCLTSCILAYILISGQYNKNGKCSPYSITERRVPELIPVLGSQRAGDVSHKLGGRLPLLSARPAVTLATLKTAATNFASWCTEARWV